MTPPDFVLRSRCTVASGGVRAADVHVAAGKIAAVLPPGPVPAGVPFEDVGDDVLFPGLVDSHVHVNDPGRTAWEGFETATRAAAAGGITTLVDMPLNSIPATTTVAGLREKAQAARGRAWIDHGFWGGVVPGNSGQLRPLLEAGVLGFKCFLVPSGVDEFPHVAEADLRAAMPILASCGAVLLAHAELPGPIEAARTRLAASGADPRSYRNYLESRPRAAENQAIDLLLRLAAEFGCRLHIVHLSSSDGLDPLALARRDGLPVTVETCPHYLTFCAEEIPDGATKFKCTPPIRERENREKLWEALGDGRLDLVATDHSPCPPEMKKSETGDFTAAWGGVSSLQISLPAVWTEARRRGHGLDRLAQWLCRGPAQLAGLWPRKGEIAAGGDADLVAWNPEAEFVVESSALHHRHKLTPYAGRTLAGVVHTTWLRGRKIFDRNTFAGEPQGSWLKP